MNHKDTDVLFDQAYPAIVGNRVVEGRDGLRDFIHTREELAYEMGKADFISENHPILDFKCSKHENPIPECLLCSQEAFEAGRQEALKEVREIVKNKLRHFKVQKDKNLDNDCVMLAYDMDSRYVAMKHLFEELTSLITKVQEKLKI